MCKYFFRVTGAHHLLINVSQIRMLKLEGYQGNKHALYISVHVQSIKKILYPNINLN